MKEHFNLCRTLLQDNRKNPALLGAPAHADLLFSLDFFERSNRGHRDQLTDLSNLKYSLYSSVETPAQQQRKARYTKLRDGLKQLFAGLLDLDDANLPSHDAFQQLLDAPIPEAFLADALTDQIRWRIGTKSPVAYISQSTLTVVDGQWELFLNMRHQTRNLHAVRTLRVPAPATPTLRAYRAQARALMKASRELLSDMETWIEFRESTYIKTLEASVTKELDAMLARIPTSDRALLSGSWETLLSKFKQKTQVSHR